MTLDWEFIQNVETKELTDDQAEVLYDQLIQYNINGSESNEQLKKLFNCSKLVMQIKAIQADVAIEELEDIITKENANKKQIKSNLDKSNDNQNELQMLELERANELLRTQLKEKDIELNRLEQTKSNLEQTLKLNEKQLQNYNQEINQLRDELQIEKEQINDQLENNNLPFEQLRDMNKKFYMLLEEMKDMETMNTQLGQKVQKLNEELNLATQQMQTATNEMQYMKNNLNNLQEMNDLLINEKEDYLSEIKRLKTLTNNYQLENDENLNNKKLQDLIDKLKEREDELNYLKTQYDLIDKKKLEEEKSYFMKEISKRDNHIKLLRNQLSQAIDDIEAQTRVIENLMQKSIESIHKSDNQESQNNTTSDNQILNNRQIINKLEEELRAKDKEMTVLHQRNTLYEKGIYGLSEAVEEIQKLTKSIKIKDNEIDNLIKELNSINLKLSNTQDEYDYLKEFLNADEDLKRKLNEEGEIKNDKLKILKLQKEIIKLDGEKLKLYEENLTFKLGGNLGKVNILNDLNHDEKLIIKDDNLKDLQKSNTLQELENENRELQLAMKEILMNLKESDSRSDVVIDCPSLERLCQFFESRSINSSLANVIALKAELDLLRGMNDELRITNKRLRNDIFKIFENYSKQLLTDFISKHQHQSDDKLESKENINKFDLNNQTLTEDEYYDSDLSEGEIILSSRSLKDNKHNQEIQTDLDYQFMNEIDLRAKEKNDDIKDELSTSSKSNNEQINQDNDSNSNENQLNNQDDDRDSNVNQLNNQDDDLDNNVNKLNNQIDQSMNQLDNKDEKPNIIANEQTEIKNLNKIFVEQSIQTDLNLDDLKNIDYLKEITELQNKYNFKDLNQLKSLLDNKSTNNNTIETEFKKEFKDSINQTELSNDQSKTTQSCSQCSLVQNLLIEFQNKIDRIDSSIVQREDLYNERINVLQEENNRLQNELQKIVQIKDDLLNQKDKMIIELNNEIVNQKEKIINLEESILKSKEEYEKNLNLNKAEIDKNQSIDELKIDNQNIDNQLSIVNRNANYSNQKGLINILETIIKSLQARIDHKDEAIKDYQQLMIKTQEEHQQEIHKLMKNYKKATENSTQLKSIQSNSIINQEQFETALTKYNDQLIEQKKNLEIQDNKLKKLKFENERLKLKSSSLEELNMKLKKDNEELNRLVEKNVKFIEKLKSAIKEERSIKHNEMIKQNEPSKLIQLNKLKEETDKLIKLLTSKDKQIKELQLNKWNLEKKISEIMQANKAELNSKQQELEKMMNNQLKLKNLLEKLENERNVLKRKQVNVIKHQSDSDYCTKEIQTNNLEANNLDSFVDSSLEETMITRSQFKNNEKNRELIDILELKRLKATKNESINRKVHQSIKVDSPTNGVSQCEQSQLIIFNQKKIAYLINCNQVINFQN